MGISPYSIVNKMEKLGVSRVLFGLICLTDIIQGQEQCSGDLWCEQGHCCGSDGTHCCTYYYELWWFWMIWGLIIMLSCCCLYQQHRMKSRQRQALRALRLGIGRHSLMGLPVIAAAGELSNTVVVPQRAGQDLRLPTYEEVQDMPKDPPAYEMLFQAGGSLDHCISSHIAPSHSESWSVIFPDQSTRSVPALTVREHSTQIVDDSDNLGLIDHEAVIGVDPPPAYRPSTLT